MQNKNQGQITKLYQQLHHYYQQEEHENVIKRASQVFLLIQQQVDAGNPKQQRSQIG